jgi:hypothetical protein
MNYKFLFLVGSALNHFEEKDFSVYTTEQRFLQTLDTIKSIKEKVPDAYILLYEGSENPIDEKYQTILEEQTDLYLECGSDLIMRGVYENLHNDPMRFTYGKSLLECRCLQVSLNHILENNLFNDTTRVLKLTGRYTLNDEFDIEDYKTSFLSNKYVMKYYDYEERFADSENWYSNIYGCKGSMITGLWSFDRFLFNDVMSVLEKSFVYMEKAIGVTSGIDIEHSFYHFIDRDKILNVPVLGIDIIKGMETANYSI